MSCCVISCNNSREDMRNLSFFRFPRDVKYQNIWINLCGNLSLSELNSSELRNWLVCEEHFSRDSFVFGTFQSGRVRKGLHSKAIPSFMLIDGEDEHSEGGIYSNNYESTFFGTQESNLEETIVTSIVKKEISPLEGESCVSALLTIDDNIFDEKEYIPNSIEIKTEESTLENILEPYSNLLNEDHLSTAVKLEVQEKIEKELNEEDFRNEDDASCNETTNSCNEPNSSVCLPASLDLHNDKKFQCDQCSFVTDFKYNLQRHSKSHSQKYFHCEHCSFKSSSESALKKHISSRHSKKLPSNKSNIFKCASCNYATSRKHCFLVHERKHNKVNSFPCQHCDYVAKYWSNLQKHLLTHVGKEVFSCKDTECSYKASNRRSLFKHTREVHPEIWERDPTLSENKRIFLTQDEQDMLLGKGTQDSTNNNDDKNQETCGDESVQSNDGDIKMENDFELKTEELDDYNQLGGDNV